MTKYVIAPDVAIRLARDQGPMQLHSQSPARSRSSGQEDDLRLDREGDLRVLLACVRSDDG
jgi:hypothetical protein